MDKKFLEQDTAWVAKQLLGCHLVCQTSDGIIRVRISETEAYTGQDDPASHAYRGMTPRNQLMFGEVGRVYVYFIYGMHHCMNIVAHPPGGAGAVLLRAGEPLEGLEIIQANRHNPLQRNLLNGPAKLTQGLNIGMSLNGYDLLNPNGELALIKKSHNRAVTATTRIGITKGKDLLWRFVLGAEDNH